MVLKAVSTAVVLLLALTGTGLTQPASTGGPTVAEPPSAGTVSGGAMPTTAKDPAALRTLIGRDVENAAGESIGEIDDVIVQDGHHTFLVISVGGFLGLGERRVTVPYDEVTMSSDAVTVNMTKEQLKRQPEYDPGAQIGTSLKGSRERR